MRSLHGRSAACWALLSCVIVIFLLDQANGFGDNGGWVLSIHWHGIPPFTMFVFAVGLIISYGTYDWKFKTSDCVASDVGVANLEEQAEVEVAEGYTMTQFCDKMIEFFMHEKPQTKDWRKFLVFRDDWKKYKENFFNRCQVRADTEDDPVMKQKLVGLARKMKKVHHSSPLLCMFHIWLPWSLKLAIPSPIQ